MQKIIAVLRKLGILRFGSASGTYTNYKDMPDELMYDNVYDKKKDLMSKEDYKHVAQAVKGDGKKPAGIKSKIMFILTMIASVFFLLCLFLVDGFKLLSMIALLLWIVYIYIFKRYEKGLISAAGITILFFILIIITFTFIGIAAPNKKQANNNNTTVPNTSESISNIILPRTTFSNGLGNWYEHVWYKPVSSGGEVTTGSGGVIFKAVQPNSRSGIMLDINKDVSSFKKVIIEAEVEARQQTLTGTGFDGREAPVAIVVSYQDENGIEHNLLGEDPKKSTQMFWRGFYYLNATGKTGVVNGIKVTQNTPFIFTFDLMTLNPKPKIIKFVAIEGAGWQSREGAVKTISINGE